MNGDFGFFLVTSNVTRQCHFCGGLVSSHFFEIFSAVCDLTPKARSIVFYESSELESALFSTPLAPGYLYGPYCKIIARTDHGNPAVPGRQSTRLGSRSGAAAVVPKTIFFLNCAPPPHQTTKPSRGWLQLGVSNARLVLFEIDPART